MTAHYDELCITNTMKSKILDEEVSNILEEETPMAYISGFRRRALEEGKLEGMMNGLMEGVQGMLEIKFGAVPYELQNRISAISDISQLESLKDFIKQAKDFEQLQRMLR